MNIKEILNKELDELNIEKLRLWNIESCVDGSLMPDYDSFVDKVLLINKLWKQVDNSKINYLFGMDIGIELALQGNVIGRRKNNNCYPYRKHNEIYLYDVSKLNDTVTKVFSRCEIYNRKCSFVLNGLPEDLMDNNYDMVMIHNHKVLIPCLEILFLDSYLSGSIERRIEGRDYELLIREYE